MTGKYIQNGYSRRSCRSRRKKRRMRLIGLTFILILVCILTVGFVWMTVAETEEHSHTGYEAENYSPQVSGTQDMPWYLTLINKENHIPGDYKPELVELKGGECVDKHIYDPLTEMLEAAKEGNLDQLPEVVSGYRTSDKQQKIYDEKIEKYKKEGYSEDEARELAKQWVAVPGYSEHQLGIAVDINGATYDVYSWLQENSYRYGFIFRYPGDKTELTGIAEEVWHYRYVGVEAATEMYEKGLCLEEYLENI